MSHFSKTNLFICVLFGVVVCPCLLTAGLLEPPAAPGPTMKPLDQVEPRIPIMSVPLIITQSGSYYLTKNLTAVGTAITMEANDVTIDLCGFTLTGPDAGPVYGINMNGRKNVEIRNGTIRDFGTAVFNYLDSAENHRIIGVRAISNGSAGISLHGGNNHLVRDCTASENGPSSETYTYGIAVGEVSSVIGNSVYNNGTASTVQVYGISAGSGSTISSNTVCNNGGNVQSSLHAIFAEDGCTISSNTVYSNGNSAAGSIWSIRANSGCTINGNVVYGNGNSATGSTTTIYGISAGNGSAIISGNTVYNNGNSAPGKVYAIYGSTGSSIRGNLVYGNGNSATGSTATIYGISAVNGAATISGNTIYDNGNSAAGNVFGISSGDGTTVTGNSVHSNGQGALGTRRGISLGIYNLVYHNTSYNNGTNIFNATGTHTIGENCIAP